MTTIPERPGLPIDAVITDTGPEPTQYGTPTPRLRAVKALAAGETLTARTPRFLVDGTRIVDYRRKNETARSAYTSDPPEVPPVEPPVVEPPVVEPLAILPDRFRIMVGNFWERPDWATKLDKSQRTFVQGYWHAKLIRDAGMSFDRAFGYQNFSMTMPPSSGVNGCGLDVDECRSKGWLMRNDDGTEMKNPGWSYLNVIDMTRASGYGKRWGEAVVAKMKPLGWKFCMADDINPHWGQSFGKLPSTITRQAWLDAFLREWRAAVEICTAAGIALIPNMAGASQSADWHLPYAKDAPGGFLVEHFANFGDPAASPMHPTGIYNIWRILDETTGPAYVQGHAGQTSPAADATYALAALLMAWRPGVYFSIPAAAAYIDPSLDLPTLVAALGKPTGPRRRTQAGTKGNGEGDRWARDFRNGTISVDFGAMQPGSDGIWRLVDTRGAISQA
jgi:hypothetical protein